MAAQYQPQGARGWIALKKTAGAATPTTGTITYLPVANTVPRNPDNINYPPLVNAAGFLTGKIAGKKTPAVGFGPIPLHTSWISAALFKSIIANVDTALDSNYNSDEYLVGINNGISTRYWSNVKFNSLVFNFDPVAGPTVNLMCDAIYGDTEGSGTITTPSAPISGSFLGAKDWDTGSSATSDPCYGATLSLIRPQAYQMKGDGTSYSDTIQSGIFGGALSIVTSPVGTVIPTTSATLRLLSGGSAVVSFALNLSRDEYSEGVAATLGRASVHYTLFNSGTSPCAIT